jgi:hypothetical protein
MLEVATDELQANTYRSPSLIWHVWLRKKVTCYPNVISLRLFQKLKLKMLCFDVDRQFLYTMKIVCMEDCFYRRNMHAHNITQHGVQVLWTLMMMSLWYFFWGSMNWKTIFKKELKFKQCLHPRGGHYWNFRNHVR